MEKKSDSHGKPCGIRLPTRAYVQIQIDSIARHTADGVNVGRGTGDRARLLAEESAISLVDVESDAICIDLAEINETWPSLSEACKVD